MPHHPPFQPLPAGWTDATAMEYDLGMPLLLWRARQMTVTRLLPVLRDRRLTEPQWRLLRALQSSIFMMRVLPSMFFFNHSVTRKRLKNRQGCPTFVRVES